VAVIAGQVPGGGCSRNGLPVLPGYVWHRGDPDREELIEAERSAASRYRDRHPEFAEQDRAVKRARWRAMLELARRHEAEFGELYAAELERQWAGLGREGQ